MIKIQKNLPFIFSLFLSTFLFVSCAGYHVSYKDNPLLSYDIRSVAVPVFVNRSVFPHAGALITQEVVAVLNQYHDLKIVAGESFETDAILLGVVDSKEKIREAMKAKSTEFSDNKSSLGKRPDFYYPNGISYDLALNLILVKRPSKEELELFKTDLGAYLNLHPKVIINETIPLSGSYQIVSNDRGTGLGGDVNYVKNEGIFEKSLQDVARNAAITFRDLILNAF